MCFLLTRHPCALMRIWSVQRKYSSTWTISKNEKVRIKSQSKSHEHFDSEHYENTVDVNNCVNVPCEHRKCTGAGCEYFLRRTVVGFQHVPVCDLNQPSCSRENDLNAKVFIRPRSRVNTKFCRSLLWCVHSIAAEAVPLLLCITGTYVVVVPCVSCSWEKWKARATMWSDLYSVRCGSPKVYVCLWVRACVWVCVRGSEFCTWLLESCIAYGF